MTDQGSNHEEQDIAPRTLKDYFQPARSTIPSCIILPLNAVNFKFKPSMIALLPTFHGLDSQNPYLYLKEFEEVCATFHDRTCSEEIVRMKMFPFSLKDQAKTWLNSLKPRSVGTWKEM